MTRGTIRKAIKTRSGISDVRIERRAIERPAPVIALVPEPVACGEWQTLGSLADDIAKRLRDRIAFPADFWKGVE